MCNPNKKFYSFLCMSLMFFCFNTNTTYAEEVCGRNYYVAACKDPVTNANVRIGTNLLKGFYYTGDNDQQEINPNYYDYFGGRNMQNLHIFFSTGTGSNDIIIYYTHDNERRTVPTSVHKNSRKNFFKTYCPNKSSIVCAKCPNGGKTSASSISASADGTDTIWDLKSIADCYVSKFADSTGSYEYITDINYMDRKEECRYAPDVPGDQIIPNNLLYGPEQEQGHEQGDDQPAAD